MIYKCEYCKTHTAHSEGMKMECVNCGAAIEGHSGVLGLYADQALFAAEPHAQINIHSLSEGTNLIEYNRSARIMMFGVY